MTGRITRWAFGARVAGLVGAELVGSALGRASAFGADTGALGAAAALSSLDQRRPAP